ncbi:fibronectin type III domain-containing protein, partial [candidate division WOR-3 bacterium]|nr:fibronectin type III domain-containing protein [candidate division WOR-3 bacterium]
MKRFISLAVAGCAAALAVVFLQSCGVLGGPPGNVQVGAATDSTVQLAWTPPVEGAPDGYVVSYRPLGDSNYVQVA